MAGERIVANLQQRLFRSLLGQEIGFFDQTRTGELTNRLASDTTVLKNAVTVNVSMALRYLLSTVGAISILMWTSWKLTLVMLLVVPIVAGAAGFYGRALRNISRQVQDALAESTAVAEEAIAGVRTVRSFAREEQEGQRYGRAIEVAFGLAKRRALLGAGFAGGISFAGFGAIVAVHGLVVACWPRRDGLWDPDLLYALPFTVAFSIGALSDLYQDFAKAIGASERVFGLLDRHNELPDGAQQLDSIEGALSLEELTFAIPLALKLFCSGSRSACHLERSWRWLVLLAAESPPWPSCSADSMTRNRGH